MKSFKEIKLTISFQFTSSFDAWANCILIYPNQNYDWMMIEYVIPKKKKQ